MKKLFSAAFPALFLCCALSFSCAAEGAGMVIKDGAAQSVYRVSDAMSADYSNENSEILRFAVYVETDFDTDLDGRPDLIKVMVQLPRAAAEGKYRAPAIYEARPYIAGMYGCNPDLPAPGVSRFDEASLRARPDKRVPKGETTVTELARTADSADWNYYLEGDPFGQHYLGNLTAYDDLLSRGFAVVQCAGPGTWGSEGIECCSSDMETDAFRCVIEWLTGKRHAFSGLSGEILVPSDWCSGRIGMVGRSYAGAMAFQVASTGVEGLETVAVAAAPASWYDYSNSQGTPNGLLSAYDSIAELSAMCASRFFNGADEALLRTYEDYLASVRDRQIALKGDYGPFWAERDYTARSGFRASALIVQGLNDETVRPKQFDLMRRAFLNCGCEVKCILHRNGHVTPANEQTKTDILIGEHTFTQWLDLWFTHYLLDVENVVSEMPDFLVQRNTDGVFIACGQWDTGFAAEMRPPDTEVHTVFAEGAGMSNYSLLLDTLDGRAGRDRLLWTWETPEEITLNGPARIHLRVRSRDTDKDTLMIGAVLADSSETAFPCFFTGAVGVLEQRVLLEGGVDRGEGAEKYDLVEWAQDSRSRAIVSYGVMDLKNPDSGYIPSSSVRREKEVGAGEWVDCTLYLQPVFYTVPAGHTLELYILPFCGFSSDEALFETYSPEELSAMGLDPLTLVPLTRDYSFDVDFLRSRAVLPIVKQ